MGKGLLGHWGLVPPQPTLVPPQPAPFWNYTATEVIDLAYDLVEKSDAVYESVFSQPGEPTLDNYLWPLIHNDQETDLLWNQLIFLRNVSPDPAVREASLTSSAIMDQWIANITSKYNLYTNFEHIWTQYKDDDKFKKENYELYRYMEKDAAFYNQNKRVLSNSEWRELGLVSKKIGANSLQFSINLGEETEYIAFTEEELAGVSPLVLEQFEKIVEDGVKKLKVTFKYPDIGPVLRTATNPETRRRAYVADQNRVAANEQLLFETLDLRRQMAHLRGYKNYAEYNLRNKMAKNEETVMTFLTDLVDRLLPIGANDLEVLRRKKAEDYKSKNLTFDGEFYAWDNFYYTNKLLQEKYKADPEEMAKYFPLQSVIDGMLSIYQTLFRLKFVEVTDVQKKNVWHEDVKQFAVWNIDDEARPKFQGWIYFDLHPRDGKYSHAANFGIVSAFRKRDGSQSYPVTVLVCNLSKPTPARPALLRPGEVTTLFHELGHGIHHLVANNKLASHNALGSVPWDFVEAPSQMLEYWTSRSDVLTMLSKHYETGDKIPPALLDAWFSSAGLGSGLYYLGQLRLGLFDMYVHTREYHGLQVRKLWNDLRREISLSNSQNYTSTGYNTFGHLMAGYAAGYYGYLWSQVFAADMYQTKFKSNPFNSTVGRQYRDTVLAPGGLYDMTDNLRKFLGRDPNNIAFLRGLGFNATSLSQLWQVESAESVLLPRSDFSEAFII
ncbi:AaceriAGR405Cp [[Ashbya] aceris (nom. inval.)]|nr:AaceriAGR405Cp [[Ashbya] aceris (nom. inval.)]